MLRLALVMTLMAVTPALAANYLLSVGGCFMPVVYPTTEACQMAGDAISGSPSYECVPFSGNNLPPVMMKDSITQRVCKPQ